MAQDGVRLPTLDAVMAAVPADFLLLVELKCDLSDDSADPFALADAALSVVQRHGMGRAIFVGFDWRALLRVKAQAPDAVCWFTTDEYAAGDAALMRLIRDAGGAGWFPWTLHLTEETAGLARAAGLKIAAWTVNHPAEMKRLAALGVDAICTDRPDMLQALRITPSTDTVPRN